MTGIANAHVARAAVLVLSGLPPRPQEGRGALQDMVHTDLVRSITRFARTVREPTLALATLAEAVACAEGRHGGEPGPAFVDFPTDVLRAGVPAALLLDEQMMPSPDGALAPDAAQVAAATDMLWSARRPLLITGRGARHAGTALAALLDRVGAPCLDTGESRGLLPETHPSVVAAMRGTAMAEADLVVTLGRRLDFQLAYGSPAVFGAARVLRIGASAGELRDNRRGAVEVFADCARALDAMVRCAGSRPRALDLAWARSLRTRHEERVAKLRAAMRAAPSDAQGRIHPNRLLAALQDRIGENAIAVADGGDFLSFARVGLSTTRWLDPGPLGCIGVGTPFGIAASLACPDRVVYVATGDGAFGFNAMEIDTAARHGAPVLIVVANNGAWQIEVHDQQQSFGKVVGTRLQFADHAAMARAFGLHAERVERVEDLDAAIDRALARRPALLDVVVSPDAVSSDAKSGLAWVPDLQALAAWDDAERKWRDGGSLSSAP
jgi:acetolactate synthase-1/2/3 large subunit